jgi:biotin carboxyl carrier protein
VTTYVALLDGGKREERLEVQRLSGPSAGSGQGLFEVRLRGRVHVVDAFGHDHGTLSLIVDTASYSAMLDWRSGTKVNVRLRHSTFPLEVLDERKLRLRRAAGRFAAEGRQAVASPMPGKVVKVLVREGDEVKAGQGLVVVEAMKMENELKSPKDGKVVEVLAVEGQAVEANAKLCTVE